MCRWHNGNWVSGYIDTKTDILPEIFPGHSGLVLKFLPPRNLSAREEVKYPEKKYIDLFVVTCSLPESDGNCEHGGKGVTTFFFFSHRIPALYIEIRLVVPVGSYL